jgi:hypothetical protein
MTTDYGSELLALSDWALRDHFMAEAQEVIEEVVSFIRCCDTRERQLAFVPVLDVVLEHLRGHCLDGGSMD